MKHTRKMVETALEQLNKYKKPCLSVELSKGNNVGLDNKVGGVPYIPCGGSIPVSTEENITLDMVAQWVLEDISSSGLEFPLKKGVLQFWYGVDMEGKYDQKVVYYPHIENYYDANQVAELFPHLKCNLAKTELEQQESPTEFANNASSDEDWDMEHDLEQLDELDDWDNVPEFDDFDELSQEQREFPILAAEGLKMTLHLTSSTLTLSDMHFDPLFTKEFNTLFPEVPIESYEDLDIPNSELDCFSPHLQSWHSILGYPTFSADDPRTQEEWGNVPLVKEYVLLFQLESEMVSESDFLELNWGNCGTASWLIHPNDLEKGDFSKVLFVLG